MFDIGWDELLLIGVVALVVIGPKDLPQALRAAGKWTRKAKLLAGEFHRTVDDMVRQSELDELRQQVEKVGRTDIKGEANKLIDPTGELERHLDIREAASLSSPAVESPVAPEPSVASEASAVTPPEDKTPPKDKTP